MVVFGEIIEPCEVVPDVRLLLLSVQVCDLAHVLGELERYMCQFIIEAIVSVDLVTLHFD